MRTVRILPMLSSVYPLQPGFDIKDVRNQTLHLLPHTPSFYLDSNVSSTVTKVDDATTADGSTGWFKIYADTWAAVAGASTGSDDNWGTKDMNNCCGHVALKIPDDIPAGDYLLRAEVIALHVAQSLEGAQFYMNCCMVLLVS